MSDGGVGRWDGLRYVKDVTWVMLRTSLLRHELHHMVI